MPYYSESDYWLAVHVYPNGNQAVVGRGRTRAAAERKLRAYVRAQRKLPARRVRRTVDRNLKVVTKHKLESR